MLGYLKNIPKKIIHGPRVIFSRRSHFGEMFKNSRYIFLNCVKTVHVRNNSFTGLSTKSIATILVPYYIKLPKFFGSRDRISRGGFGFWDFSPIFEIEYALQIVLV